MAEFIAYLIAGIATGAIYALAAIGFTLVWQTSQTINFAQGEFVMLPAVLVLLAIKLFGAPVWLGALIGIAAFAMVIFAAPMDAIGMLCFGVAGIGAGGGLFAVGTLTAAMTLAQDGHSGLALGAWGAVQASAAGVATAIGGLMRDGIGALARDGALGAALAGPATGYAAVYQLEILLLFAMLAALGPLVRGIAAPRSPTAFGLSEFPT